MAGRLEIRALSKRSHCKLREGPRVRGVARRVKIWAASRGLAVVVVVV